MDLQLLVEVAGGAEAVAAVGAIVGRWRLRRWRRCVRSHRKVCAIEASDALRGNLTVVVAVGGEAVVLVATAACPGVALVEADALVGGAEPAVDGDGEAATVVEIWWIRVAGILIQNKQDLPNANVHVD